MDAKKMEPCGDLELRTLAMPADTNPAGDIFGGWVLSQMDIAGGIFTKKICNGRTVTVAIKSMTFHLPVLVGDVLCCYVKLIKTGKTSITVNVEVWSVREYETQRQKVTEGTFVYVSVDHHRKPKLIQATEKE